MTVIPSRAKDDRSFHRKENPMKKNPAGGLLALILCASLLTGCGAAQAAALDAGASVLPDLTGAVTAGSEKPAAGEILITLSDEGTSCDSDAVRVEGGTVTVTAEGTYRLSGTLSDGQIVVSAPEDAKVRLILDGAEITKTGSAAICALSADKLILSSAAGSVNRLASAGDFAQTDGDNTDAAVFAKCDLSLGGDGTILVSCETGHGLVSKDDLKVRGGTVSVTAAKKGLEGKDSLTVEGGTLLIDAGTKGLVSSNDESDEVGVIEILDGNLTVRSGDDSVHAAGRVQIAGGTLTLSSGDDGIHAGNRIEVSGGSITVLESYEGLEAQVIEVSGGEIDVTASDDGFNAAGGSDGSNGFGRFGGDPFQSDANASITISGGSVHVDAGGDGLDSNGSLNVSGGVITVSGPTNNGNGALDYGTSASITGGTVIAAGASGMAENFGGDSTQGSILLSFETQEAGSTVSVSDESGRVLASFTPSKPFSSVVVSVEGLEVGGSYTVTAGTYSETVTLTSAVYGSGMGMGGRMDGRPGGTPPGFGSDQTDGRPGGTPPGFGSDQTDGRPGGFGKGRTDRQSGGFGSDQTNGRSGGQDAES